MEERSGSEILEPCRLPGKVGLMREVRFLLLLPPTRPAGPVSSSGTVAGRHGGLGPTSCTGSGRCGGLGPTSCTGAGRCGRLGPAACSGAYRRLAPAGGPGPPCLLVLVVLLVLLANPRRRELVNIQILKATINASINNTQEYALGYVFVLSANSELAPALVYIGITIRLADFFISAS
jgi:hypothetical protein